MRHWCTTTSRAHRRLKAEHGEVASWLILAAGLAAAAALAAATMGFITSQLAANVAEAAAGGDSAALISRGDGTGSTDPAPGPGPDGETAGDDSTTTITQRDGRPAIIREGPDGSVGMVSVDDDGTITVVQVEADGTVHRAEAAVTEEDAGWRLGDWHFSGRDQHNSDLPATVSDVGDGWTELTAAQAVFHDDPETAGPERKFIHVDGREAVYNPETGELVTDPRYAGTYNYVNPAPVPENPWDVGGWASWTFRGIGHGVTDVIPYFFGGNVRGPDDAGGD